nr:uncharacterized protein LOC117279649 [Nicotiana tomentosiformis]
MAKVAAAAPVDPSNVLNFGSDGGSKVTTTTLKAKTPTELRVEQLKRENFVELVDESPASASDSMSKIFWQRIVLVLQSPMFLQHFLLRVNIISYVEGKNHTAQTFGPSENCKANIPSVVSQISQWLVISTWLLNC